MKMLKRLYLGAGLLGSLVLVGWSCPGALPHSAGSVWNPFELLEQSRREDRRARALVAEHQMVLRHFQVKHGLIAEMVAGRRSLWEVVRLLRDQGVITPLFLERVRANNPGCTDDDAVARNIMLFAAVISEEDPTQAAAMARLEAELARGPVP
jgi:hypothetical protein